MIVSYKIRIYPNKTQKNKCKNMFGCCRYVYNQFINYNSTRYKEGYPHTGWKEYRKNIKEMRETDCPWLKEVNKHSLDYSVKTADSAYIDFMKGKKGFPHFKSKKHPVQSFYLDSDGDKIQFYKKHVKIPFLGSVRITEPNYVPKDYHIMGITIKLEEKKYYATFRVKIPKEELDKSEYMYNFDGYGYGIDVGVKTFATIADSYLEIYQYPSFLYDKRIRKQEERIKRLQKIISDKMKINYNRLMEEYSLTHDISLLSEEELKELQNKKKGESFSNSCRYIQKKINRCHRKITNIKKDMIDKIVTGLVKNKPEYITIETLDIKDMLEGHRSKTLKRHIQDSKFRYFFEKLKFKCHIYNIELRQAFKYFASSKECCICHTKNKNIKLYNRIFECVNDLCCNIMDRDVNAAINLLFTDNYIVFKYKTQS